MRYAIAIVSLFACAVAGPIQARPSTYQPNTPMPGVGELGMLVMTLEVPPGLDWVEVDRCVADAMAARKWRIIDRSEGTIVGYINHRAYEARSTVVIEDESVRIYCSGYIINRKGERVRPHIPANWIKYLSQDIRIGFGVDPNSGGYIEDVRLDELRTELAQRIAQAALQASTD